MPHPLSLRRCILLLATALGCWPGAAAAQSLSVTEPARPFTTDLSLAGTWARTMWSQPLGNAGPQTTLWLHVHAAVNPQIVLDPAPARCAALAAPCPRAVPDWTVIRTRERGAPATVTELAPAWANAFAIEMRPYAHLGSLGPFLVGWRVRMVPVVASFGARAELAHTRVRDTSSGIEGASGTALLGAVGSLHLGFASGTLAWTPVAAPLWARRADDAVDGGGGGLAPSAFTFTLDADFPTARRGLPSVLSPELRLRSAPLPPAVAGLGTGGRATLVELTAQVVAVVY